MAGDMPWPQVEGGNAGHTNAAVVIIGAGISGMLTSFTSHTFPTHIYKHI